VSRAATGQGGAAAELPGVVGVGTDLVDVDRLRTALARTPGLRTRLFTPDEWAYAERHRDPHPHLAARFAAKEAVMKALGRGMSSMGFAEIEVVRDEHGVPSVRLHGAAADLAAAAGVVTWQVSLTHTDALAQAVAIAIGEGAAPLPAGAQAEGVA
jgi:holo-[acyl-carrier protein] synthase